MLRWLMLLLCVGALAIPGLTPAGEIDLLLQQRLALGGDEAVAIDVVLRAERAPAGIGPARRNWIRERQDAVLRAFAAQRIAVTRRYENLAGFAALAPPELIRRLAARPEVERVALDLEGRLELAEGTALVGADVAVSHGFTGSGVTVAVLDSGVDASHVDLASSVLAEECFCSTCCPNGLDRQSGAGSALDTAGHGTAVAGIITADGVLAGPGVAPASGIVAIKVVGDGSNPKLSDVGAGLDWLVGNHTALGVRVVNLSSSFGATPTNDTAACAGVNNTANAIAELHAAGVAVFVAAGNNGWGAGVGFPACVPEAIAVGAVYDAAFGALSWQLTQGGICSDPITAPDMIACLTNSGAPLDLLAPSWRTRTTAPGGVTPDFGGTSSASPYAAGQAALLLQVVPSSTPDELLALLVSSGVAVTRASSGGTFARADVAAALQSLLAELDSDADGIRNDGDDSGTPGDAPCTAGSTTGCDDNCPSTPNSTQADADGDGIGNACRCGDVSGDGLLSQSDVSSLRAFLAGSLTALPGDGLSRCSVSGSASSCDAADVAVLVRALALPPLGPGAAQVCSAASAPF